MLGDVDAPLVLCTAPGELQCAAPTTALPLSRLGDLHRLGRAATSRLIASVAYDVLGSVASIVYSADFLDDRGSALQIDTLRETLREIYDTSRRLQLTVDGLLDYAELGPAISVPVSLLEVLHHAHGVLRSLSRNGALRLRIDLGKDAAFTRGNPIIVEQIFVNLLLACAKLGGPTSLVHVRSSAPTRPGVVQVQLSSERRGRAAHDGERSGLSAASEVSRSLLDARMAAESQGGRVVLEDREQSCVFTVELLRSEGTR